MPHFNILNLFTLLCGIALFLYGMQQGEKNLKKLGVGRLRQMVGAITRHRIAAYGTGFITTLITQSSSATTVLLVGFASAQLMTLRQSLGVILGSDLGTTVTVQLFAFKFYLVSPLLIALGFTMSLLKKSGPLTLVGKLVLAAGFVFFGMQLMTEASAPLQSYPLVARLLQQCFSDIWTGLAVGMLLTVIFQSSAATLAIVMTLAVNVTLAHDETPGLAGFLPIVLGANIGTCSTAFLALLEAKEEGVRVAWAHLLFKACGAVLALPFAWLLPGTASAASGLSPAIQIAALHTGFNLYISVFFLPMLPLVDRVIRRYIVPAGKEGLRFRTQFLHDNVLPFPVLALSQAVKEISRMSDMVVQMVEESLGLVRRYDLRTVERIVDKDDEVDFLHERIMTFLTQIAREELGPDEASRSYELIMVTTDLEHIGDIVSKRITELAEKIDHSPTPLSQEGQLELLSFFSASLELLRKALAAFAVNDTGLAHALYVQKEAVKGQFSSLVKQHLDRLYHGRAQSLQTSPIHVDLLEEIDRVNHFTFRIAAHVLKIFKAE